MDLDDQSRWGMTSVSLKKFTTLCNSSGVGIEKTLGALISELRREWQGEIKKSLVDVKLPSIKPYISGRATAKMT